jgi:probable rRNA maturation factor
VKTPIDLHLSIACQRLGVPARSSFLLWISQALKQSKLRGQIGLSIRVVAAAEGLALNQQYRGKDYPTNVLSFPATMSIGKAKWLGDIVLCHDVLAREAKEQGKALRDHFAHLSIHGVLHLLGYDHVKNRDAKIMEQLEIVALKKVHIENPYSV